MDVYRRLTRCSDVETVHALQKDVTDAYGELPRQVVVLFALTELRLLAGHFGISSIVKKEPDVVFTVADAQRASIALTGAPGRLTVLDEKTVYLRLPPTFLEADTLLLALCNLMRSAKSKESPAIAETALPPASTELVKPPAPVAQSESAPPQPSRVSAARQKEAARAKLTPVTPKASEKPAESVMAQIAKLTSLREAGILTEQEFEAAQQRLLAAARG
jgi:hypothetical protein